MQKSIAILTGGWDGEREVGLRSSKYVIAALEKDYRIELFNLPEDLDLFLSKYKDFAIAIPIIHGKIGEDGRLQGVLETLGVKFPFSGSRASNLCMAKHLANAVAKNAGLNVPNFTLLDAGQTFAWNTPTILKPCDGGSSLGLQVMKSAGQTKITAPTLAQDLIVGREFTVGVIEHNDAPIALPVAEIIHSGTFGFEEKYSTNSTAQEICPANVDRDLNEKLQKAALQAHTAFGCRHLSRTDLMVDSAGKVWFLETNTIPGMTQASFIPKMLRAANIEPTKLFTEWLNSL